MKIKELRNYLMSLPEELDNLDIVYSEVITLTDKMGVENEARKTINIDGVILVQDHDELVFAKNKTLKILADVES